MKFMLNGAVTLGTLDGANVEMLDEVGEDNIFIFGARAHEIARMESDHSYNPKEFFDRNADIHDAVSHLVDGTLPGFGKEGFEDLCRSLLFGDYDRADKYFLLYDFDAYRDMFETVLSAYTDWPAWTKKAILNTASAGYFSVDRTIAEYNQKIWGLKSI
jgi:starch phosphorylase